MYREELDELVAMFERSCEKVTISDSEYRYVSLEEMKEKLPPRIKALDIQGEKPNVRFLFNHTEISNAYNPPAQIAFNELRTEEITDGADALFYKLKEFLLAHQQPSFPKTVIGAIVSVIGAFGFAFYHGGDRTFGSKPGFFICMAAFAIFVIATQHIGNYFSLELRRNSASFFVRNWEEFANHAVIAVIGGAVGYCIGRFLK